MCETFSIPFSFYLSDLLFNFKHLINRCLLRVKLPSVIESCSLLWLGTYLIKSLFSLILHYKDRLSMGKAQQLAKEKKVGIKAWFPEKNTLQTQVPHKCANKTGKKLQKKRIGNTLRQVRQITGWADDSPCWNLCSTELAGPTACNRLPMKKKKWMMILIFQGKGREMKLDDISWFYFLWWISGFFLSFLYFRWYF